MLVNNEVLKKILISFLTIAQNNKNRFDERDVKLVSTSKWWAMRFALISETEDEAVNSLVKCME